MVKLPTGDDVIIEFLAHYVNLTPYQLSELTSRSPDIIWRRLRALGGGRTVRKGPRKGETESGMGYVNYVLENMDSVRTERDKWDQERVYFLTQKGWNRALEMGSVKFQVNATDEKTNQNTDHDLKLTKIHLALFRRFGHRLHWFQYRPYTYFPGLLNADAFFWLDLGDRFPAYFVEVENHKESGHRADGDLVDKMRQYQEFVDLFAEQPHYAPLEDFRVLTYRLSEAMARNFAHKLSGLEKPLVSRRFLFSDIPSAIQGTEKFITPKDYKQATYFINDL